jgi:nucleoside-diphosphate-sugar epimerase
MNKINVLITGASGFIGKPLTKKLLSMGYKILALSRKNQKISNNPNINWLKADLSNIENIKDKIRSFKPEIVIHLSWENIPIFNLDNSLKNLNNSIGFFRFILSLNTCKKILVSGSCLEYSKSYGMCEENENIVSNNYLTWAKNSLRSWLEIETLNTNCKLGWFRIFYVYGPNQRKRSLIPSLINTFIKRQLISINNIYNANDFIYIDDVVDAFISFLKVDGFSGIYNLGTGKTTSIIEISYIIEKLILGSSQKTDDFLKIKSECNINKTSNFFANINKALIDLDWKPKNSIKEGLSKTLDNYI